MSQQSAIEWTESTWNPVTGCDRISPGCDHCYAMTLAARLKRMGQPRYQRDGDPRTSGPGFGLTLHEDKIDEPLSWRKPRVVFVNSMSDLFHKDVPMEFVARVFGVMAATPQHTYQVLTKRPKRMARMLQHPEFENVMRRASGELGHALPLPNVWLGTSIESSAYRWRADYLHEAPAAVRFISAEPLLAPLLGLDLTQIDWLIVGGESGPNHRPMQAEWVRELRDLAGLYDTRFFFKQWGGPRPTSNGRELDGRTWDEMPDRLVLA
jgi:protein gp37